MRNEFALAASLVAAAALPAVRAAGSVPGLWFPPSACGLDDAVDLAPPGGRALLRVHDAPEHPPHDALLRRGADGVWRASLEEWRRWTARPPAQIETGAAGSRLVPLRESADFAFRVDSCTAELWVDTDPQRTALIGFPTRVAALPATTPAGFGGFLNLDAEYGGFQGAGVAGALADLGLFHRGGAARSAVYAGSNGLRRLDSYWLHDEPAEALRLRLGDAITRSAEWESAARFGGVQWGTDFSLQPERITFPLPSMNGSAALPSTLDIYVDGQRLSQQSVQPGNFRLVGVPTLTGAGELSVVVRDALGRERTVVQSFYASPRLLAAGLSANTFEAGALRESYARDGDRYDHPFAAATLRRGLSEALTGSVRAVAGDRRQLAGGSADWKISDFGLLTVSAAGAHSESGWGGAGTLAFERVTRRFSFALRREFATRAYADLGRDPQRLHFQDAARASYNAGRAGSWSAVYVSEQPWSGAGARLAGLAYSRQLWRSVEFDASWLHTLGGSDAFLAGFTVLLGAGSSGGAQWTHESGQSGVRAFVQHAPGGPLGWSYRALGDGDTHGVREGEVEYAGTRGSVGAGFAGFGGSIEPGASLRTGWVAMDGDLYWTRPLQDSFAVVDAGAPNVRVYRDNLDVGRTGADGRLLVPDLRPYEENALRIDERDLPITRAIADSLQTVAPPAGAGVPVRFAADPAAPLRLRLVDAGGVPPPAGAALYLDGLLLALPLGRDGLVYAAIAPGKHALEAGWSARRCRAELVVKVGAARLGRCEEVY